MMKYFIYPLSVLFIFSSGTAVNVERSEMTFEFTPLENYDNSVINTDDIKIDAKKDIPELFEQKYSIVEPEIEDSVMTKVNGFRLQVFRSEDFEEAKKRESMYIENFGEENVVLIFESPFYRIRVGKFKDREEAETFRESLRRRGIYRTMIVPDVVEILMPVDNK